MVRFASSRRGRVVGGLIAALSAVLFSTLAIADAEAKTTLAAREVVIPAPGSKQAANPDPLALPDKPYCPKTLYGKWYPFTRGTMRAIGIMEIKKNRIRFGKLGEFPFKIRKGPHKTPYFELFKLQQHKRGGYLLKRFAFVGYSTFQVLDNACTIQLSLCVSKDDVEKRIEHDWLPTSAPENYHCDLDIYAPYRDKERLKRYLFDYPRDE
ncbi:hypothetical protein [Varunaivibrio sulfuroxidans]|uniref:Uncharacterized protein n=1 Tax=Varunaivibrio sulfuroxidans TaxID=1773489 RepID=A0A4R3J507_9PROT|nr:hypothetical protein [Varunaivibrio sulfuroxidans]TCS60387.1 hypothetical protein EDD55_11188 [Varunaivibrio sulfuroxidans]WES30926.1 hypothetical protein P3M64_00695 [Varunaivibrio sulfuroxidans]